MVPRAKPYNKEISASKAGNCIPKRLLQLKQSRLHVIHRSLRSQLTVILLSYRYLTGQMRLTTLAVHPAYWKHGHGTRLTNWCTRLADLDRVPIGVSAAKMGVKVFTKAGFQEEVRVQIEGYELPDESRDSFACNEKEPANVASIELWIGVRCPQQRRWKLSWGLWRTWNCFKAEE